MNDLQHFVDDDPGYRTWLAGHPDGFVVNTGRTPTPTYLVLHRASCHTISGDPARGSTFPGDYTKVCGDEPELENFATELGGHLHRCAQCLGRTRRTRS